ncbi:hypothetical protein J2Z53_000915 [Clostridium moniliforme]|uniref:Uncharacterized protein n=1 Tax=Clostridium moniliforme TaxID=39489 RepID=A0ABS4EZB3_9CLOT|nr:hypothetical protein [Clostridium moniliforme]
MLYCLDYCNQSLLKEKYSKLSNDVILTNFGVLSKRVNELNHDEGEKYKNYLLNQCTMVQIVTDSEQEAFQFFDSQNSRGKELAPHDLLKSYHLREMRSEDENQKVKIISKWENMDQDDLDNLFKSYLYPLIQWYKGKDGLGYNSSKIDYFKGIKVTNIYDYAIYHKASNLYVEQFNANVSNEFIAFKQLNQFQLTQPLIAGRRFFNYTIHYGILLEKIQKQINGIYKKDEIPDKRSGDIYIKQLYECSLLFFADRFGIESLTKYVIQQLYSWSYSLRLAMNAVYPQTINKYAKGQHERANYGINMFSEISEMSDPEELKLLVLKKPDISDNNKEKYKAVYKLLSEWNRW